MTKLFSHYSVMTEACMSFFKDSFGKIFVDATAGGGGHLAQLAALVGNSGHVIAFDRDSRAHQEDAALGVACQFDNIKLFKRAFSEIKTTLKELNISSVDGILCDLGVSSHQLDEPTRGFSFLHDGPIDMRMDQSSGLSAYEWLASSSEGEIADAIFNYGGERKSRAIASLIKKSWPIENSTHALAKLILSAMRQKHWSKIHPATRTFQAIRMAVNDEVGELRALLNDLPEILAPRGVAVFLSFHSVEDRMIKLRFRELAQKKVLEGAPLFELLTKKPLIADAHELSHNRRSRSAKLRALRRSS